MTAVGKCTHSKNHIVSGEDVESSDQAIRGVALKGIGTGLLGHGLCERMWPKHPIAD
jgi:hypothetical protein